jgi:phosphatidate cytidylyltransferase
VTPRAPRKAPGLAARVVTALVLGIVVLAAIVFARTTGLAVLLAIVSAMAAAEFYALGRQERRRPNELLGVVAAGALPLAAAFFPASGLVTVVTGLVLLALVWHLAFTQVCTGDTAVTVFGALYTGLTLAHLVLLAALPDVGPRGIAAQGEVLVLVTFVSVWANDVFAYFVGVAVGRHKLMPHISPGKSWEGFAGGAVCALLVWIAAFSLSTTKLGGTGLSLAWHVGIGVAVPLAALVGDLVESRFKREAGVKDSGGLLPGHGGFLDRFDSMIAVSVVVYYLTVLARSL